MVEYRTKIFVKRILKVFVRRR